MAQGVAKDTRGTAFVVYEDIYDAKMAVEHLSGFNVANRYLIVLYYNPSRQTKKVRHLRAAQADAACLMVSLLVAKRCAVSGGHHWDALQHRA